MAGVKVERWREFSVQLGHALEMPAAQRAAWLATLRERDADMAASVEAALANREREDFAGFLQGDLLRAAGTADRAALVGRRVGAYQIDAEIGAGGMGSVWRAHRADGRFAGTVAIKFVHTLLAGRASEQRFRNEGDLLARLNHPNIARLMDAGVLEGVQPYLVLEFVAGKPIDQFCEQHALALEARIGLFLSVLEAVSHAHSHLVVHRDIKPANICVTDDGGVKLLDFGIAKLLRADAVPSELTQLGGTALTPQYAAPEQVLGQEVTTATDVYALGLVLYVLLAGGHPVSAEARSGAAVLHAVLSEDPPPPSAAAAPATVPRRRLEGDLDNIILKALKKNPAERYGSAAAFAEDLRRYLAHQPVIARPDSAGYRVGKFVRRHRAGAVAAMLVSVALLAVTGFALWQAQRAQRERDLALLQARRADSEGEFMSGLLGDFSRGSTPQAQRQQLDRARELLDQRHYDDPTLRANLLTYLSGRYAEFGYTATAIDLLQEAKAVLRAEDVIASAQVGCGLANMYDDLGREEEAEREIRSAMSTLESLGGVVRPQVLADCRLVASYVATARGQNRLAIAAAQRALAELRSAGVSAGMGPITALNALARADGYAGHNAEAVRILRELNAGDWMGGKPQTIAGWIHGFNEARDLLAGGRVLEAEHLAGILAANSGSDNARDVTLVRAEALHDLGRDREALQLLETPGEHSLPGSGALQRRLTRIELHLATGDLALAHREWNELPAAGKDATAGPDGVRALRIAALLASADGDVAAADGALTRAAALAVDADGAPTPEMRGIAVLRAEAALRRGATDAACQSAGVALARARTEAVELNSSAWIGEALLLRAHCEFARAQQAAGRSDARAALPHLEQNLGAQHPLTAAARNLSAAPGGPAP